MSPSNSTDRMQFVPTSTPPSLATIDGHAFTSQQMSPGMLAAAVSAAAQQQGLVTSSGGQPGLVTASQPTFQVTTAPQFVQHAGGSAPMAFAPSAAGTAGPFVPVSELAMGGRLLPTAAAGILPQQNISIMQPGFIHQQAGGVIVQGGTPQKNIVEISID